MRVARLTEKQRRFVEEYLIDLNATEAAIRAGYSEKTARSIGNENLTKPDIRAAIDRRLKELADARLLKMQEAQEFLAAAVRGEVTEVITTPGGKKIIAPIRAADRLRAADLYFKIQGAYREQVEVKMSAGELLKKTLEKMWNEN